MQITHYGTVPSLEHPNFWIHQFDAGLWRQVVTDLFGNDDLGESAERRWALASREAYTKNEHLVASIDGVPVGMAEIEFPQKDNRHIAYLSLAVDRDHRCRGVGAALYEEFERMARADGRTNFQAWSYEPLVPTGTRTLRGSEGDGVIDPEAPPARFLLSRGFRLMQVDTMSVLTLPDDLVGPAAAARERTPSTYELIQWSDLTPQEWLEPTARLQRAMSTDIPTGGAELEEEEFDATRIELSDTTYAAAGVLTVVTAAVHVPSGELVGCTRIVREPGKPEAADQWETIVLRAHRGHGLGMLLKTANHVAAARRWPTLRRLVTGNASENQHMLRINRELGYLPVAASGWFEKKL